MMVFGQTRGEVSIILSNIIRRRKLVQPLSNSVIFRFADKHVCDRGGTVLALDGMSVSDDAVGAFQLLTWMCAIIHLTVENGSGTENKAKVWHNISLEFTSIPSWNQCQKKRATYRESVAELQHHLKRQAREKLIEQR